MARGGQLRATPRIYEVGEDISSEQYHEAIQKIADWFAQSRNTKEPVASAKFYLDCCLKGVKPSDGKSPWDSMATSTLAARVRSACRFDIDLMVPLITPNEKLRQKKEREREKAKERKLLAKVDSNYPEEYRKKIAGEAVYGDDPLVFFTTKELEKREALRESYLNDFPQLRSVASQSKLDMLLDLTLLMERLRFRQAKDEKGKATEFQMQSMTKQIVDLEKALNIHPDQLAKQQKDKEGGTIGEAVRRLDEANPLELREKWFAEELLVLYQMYHQPSPRQNMEGYQLDDVGLFGLTRCRTCACSHCGTKNYAGLGIKDVEGWLEKKGYLTEVENDQVEEPESVLESSEPVEESDDAGD